MRLKYLHAVIVILGLYVVGEVDGGKIISGIKHVYQGAKCGLHKLGDKIYHHEHSMDPCDNDSDSSESTEDNKSTDVSNELSQGTTTTSTQIPVSSTTYIPQIDIRMDNTPDNSYPVQGRRIYVGANCPEGYRADKYGVCRLEY